jgi:plastocyanin
MSAFVGQRDVLLSTRAAAMLSAAESHHPNVPAVPAKNNLPTDTTAYRESARHGAGFSASATAIEFYFNDDPPVYAYTEEAQEITATVELSIATQGEYDPQDPLPTWTVTITREIDQVDVATVDFTYLDEPYSDPIVSIELPADAGEYEYTATLTSGDGNPDPLTKTAYVVDVEKIQYDSGGENFIDVPDPLRVHKGATVTFKAIRDPESAPDWPTDKPVWTRDPGQEDLGIGETKNVAFNTAGTYTVIAECGNTAEVTVIVVEVEKLRYKYGAMPDFVDAPTPPGVLYVPFSASTVTFQAIPNPIGDWPEEKPVWQVNSVTEGIGETVVVTLNSTGEFTVTAECGNIEPVNLVVYTIDLSTADENPVAVGGVANAPHQKTIKATLRPLLPNPSGVTFSIIGDTGVNIAASLSSTVPVPFNEQGEAEVTLTSSDYLEDIIVEGQFMNENEQMIVRQEVWQYHTFSFTHHENTTPMTTDIAFSIAQQGDGQIPLQGHDIHFSIVDVYAYLDDEWVQVQPSEWSDYAVLQTPTNDTTDGNGTANSVIEWGEGDIIVYIQAEDHNVWIPSN